MKRSPLPPRRTPLPRGKPLARGKRLNPRSQKTIDLAPVRAEVRRQVIERDGSCRIGPMLEQLLLDPVRLAELDDRDQALLLDAWRRCAGPSASVVHEPGARSRDIGSQYDPGRCLLVCEDCHRFTHAHPKAARLAGATL